MERLLVRPGLGTRHHGFQDLPGLVPPKPPVAPLFPSLSSAKKTLVIVTGTQGGDLSQPHPTLLALI